MPVSRTNQNNDPPETLPVGISFLSPNTKPQVVDSVLQLLRGILLESLTFQGHI